MKIGVFDSGIGGLSIANAIKNELPDHEVIFKNDATHVPYGSKTIDQILAYSLPILQSLVEEGVSCIVIACNTLSTNLISELRQLLSVPLIAVEPMVKPAAAMTKTGVIAVCATPSTLSSARYQELKQSFARNVTVLEPDCSDWATMVEESNIDRQNIYDRLSSCLEQQADVVVLACTHFHWIEEDINRLVNGRATVIQPEAAIVAQLKKQMSL